MRRIRLATVADAEAVAAIYAPYVRETSISFEVEPPDASEVARRIERVLAFRPWLVCEDGGAIAGYAYATEFRARPAYRWSAELAVYVDRTRHGGGIGTALYEAMLRCLRAQGYRTVIGGVTLPNPASVALHERLGFSKVGVFRGVGFKNGARCDVGMWQLDLDTHPDQPPPLRSIRELAASPDWESCVDVFRD